MEPSKSMTPNNAAVSEAKKQQQKKRVLSQRKFTPLAIALFVSTAPCPPHQLHHPRQRVQAAAAICLVGMSIALPKYGAVLAPFASFSRPSNFEETINRVCNNN
jgi:hypothetical protein